MRVELTGFSQGVSLANKGATVNYLDFRREDGRLFRVPISDEALNGLMAEVYGADAQGEPVAEEPEPAPEDEADVFGDEEPQDDNGPVDDGFPESEDEVQSL